MRPGDDPYKHEDSPPRVSRVLTHAKLHGSPAKSKCRCGGGVKMQKLDLPSLPRSVFLVALFVTGMVSTRVASSQIFGSVSAHGTIVLTNIATSAGHPE